ncbi:MAG: DUF6091 family protein [Pseudomonadales bacterium]|nr:DUF6091 family protein [Pseudomonadales bacterium]
MIRKINLSVLLVVILIIPGISWAKDLKTIKFCALSLMGESGPEVQIIRDYEIAALGWGAKLETKLYPNEKIIVNELKSGACDMATLTSAEVSQFNSFTGTLGAMGAIPDYNHLKLLLATLNSEKARKHLVQNGFEVVGIQPAGAVFIFLADRYLRGFDDLAGRKVGVLDSFPEMHQMVTEMGMTPVSSTLTNIFQKFNNGVIDIVGGPAIVFEVMELHKGLKDTGSMIEAPIMQASIQIVARSNVLPDGFGAKSRNYIWAHFDESLEIIRAAEEAIPRKYRLPVPKCNREEMEAMSKRIRLRFRDEGIYDGKMLTLLRKIRCKVDASRAECTDPNAE